jgi:hypothetical protein
VAEAGGAIRANGSLAAVVFLHHQKGHTDVTLGGTTSNAVLRTDVRANRLALPVSKKALEHGQFEQMVQDELPFGPRTAQRLMAIAGDERLTKAPHASLLPQGWMTLYELTRLTDEQFAAAVADGAINPEMRRTEAEALRGGPSLVRSSEDHKGLPFVRPSVWPQHEDAQPTRATVSVKQTLPRELAGRPSHISEMPRYRAVFERPSYAHRD